MNNHNLDVRVYPIDEPKGNTLAFASVAVDDKVAIRGVRVIDGEKGLFMSMPQSQDKTGKFHDMAFPLTGELRKEMSEAVLNEYEFQASLDLNERGYAKPAQETNDIDDIGDISDIGDMDVLYDMDALYDMNAEAVKLDVKVFPLSNPKGDVVAFASVGIDDTVAIRGIQVEKDKKGLSVHMPQTKDKEGNSFDVAFPLSGDLRLEVSRAVIKEFKEVTAERKKSINERLTEGREQSAQIAANAPERQAMAAKKPPGLGD
jgi:stage V sporulation protein G